MQSVAIRERNEKILLELLKNKKTIEEIAKEFGVSRNTIWVTACQNNVHKIWARKKNA